MGNILQCCQTLSNYFKWQDVSAQRGGEQSNLLSSDETESESPSDSHTLEDDLLTVSIGITNPALEPEHFLFPDIILSSNPAGEVTLAEPMVCLLVSEEEDGLRLMEPEYEKGEGERRGFSDIETHVGMGVQTETKSQAEVQTQTEMLRSDETEEEKDEAQNRTKSSQEIRTTIKTEQKLEEDLRKRKNTVFPVRCDDPKLQMRDLNSSFNHQSVEAAEPSTSHQCFLEGGDEEGSGMKQGPLLFLDRLFSAAAHGRGEWIFLFCMFCSS